VKIVSLLSLFLSLPLLASQPAIKCEDLAAKKFTIDPKAAPGEVTIHSATVVAAKGNLPEHCDVRGVIWPEAKFAIKLPTEWNDRFQMVGNGGTAGVISLGAVDAALRKGFAGASTDTGHDAAKEPVATSPGSRRRIRTGIAS
jgi:Tannase and feruloyl esterase